MKNLTKLFTNVALIVWILFVLFFILAVFFDLSKDSTKSYFQVLLTDSRNHDVEIMKKEVEEYYKREGIYPIAKDFSKFRRIYPIEQDAYFHYSYESNGTYFIIGYPYNNSDNLGKATCKIISSPEIDPAIVKRNCDIVIQPLQS